MDQNSIFEDHTSVIISGTDDFDWYGYAFGNPGPRDPVAEEYENMDDAYGCEIEEGTDEWYHAEVEDFFAAGGCQADSAPGQPIMNPRVYFLRAVQHRLHVVVQSHEYLVQKLEESFDVWVSRLVPCARGETDMCSRSKSMMVSYQATEPYKIINSNSHCKALVK